MRASLSPGHMLALVANGILDLKSALLEASYDTLLVSNSVLYY